MTLISRGHYTRIFPMTAILSYFIVKSLFSILNGPAIFMKSVEAVRGFYYDKVTDYDEW